VVCDGGAGSESIASAESVGIGQLSLFSIWKRRDIKPGGWPTSPNPPMQGCPILRLRSGQVFSRFLREVGLFMSQDEDVFSEESCASDGGSHPSASLRAGSFRNGRERWGTPRFSSLWRNRPTYRAQLLSDRSVRPTRAMLIAAGGLHHPCYRSTKWSLPFAIFEAWEFR
jgi:hypothetical protein